MFLMVLLSGCALASTPTASPVPPTFTPEPTATPIATLTIPLTPSASVTGESETVVPPLLPTQYLEFSNLKDLQKAAKFPIWLPTYIPDDLPLYKAWVTDYANGNQNVRLLYSEQGNSRDANLKSIDIQMTMTDETISNDSITHQFKVTALDVREVQVRDQMGFTYWTRSGAAGNSAHLVWREGSFNFSIVLFGAWPQPDESNSHGLDNVLLMIARSLQIAQ
jgi:hypothetical protein